MGLSSFIKFGAARRQSMKCMAYLIKSPGRAIRLPQLDRAAGIAFLQEVNVRFGAVIPTWSLAGIGRNRSISLRRRKRQIVRQSRP